MQVNTTRWGTPDTWVEYIQSAGICRPSNAKNSYAMAYNLGSTPDESMHTSIDLSVAPWGLNKNSLLNKRYYIAPYVPSEDEENTVELIPINEEELTKDKPLILNGNNRIVTAGGSSFSNDEIFDGNAKLLNNYNPNYPQFSSVTTYTNWAVNNVICNFNYHNIMMLPLIVTSPGSVVNDSNIFNINTYTSGMFYTFDEFIANYDSQIKGKKVVKGFMVVEYLGSNGNRSKSGTNNIQYTIPYKVPARPSFSDMADNNKRFPTVDIDTMVSSSYWSDGSAYGHRIGFPNVRHADWLRWYNTYTGSSEKCVNYWSGANYGGTNTEWRTTCFDDEIFEYYYQPFVSGQNRQGIALIRTEEKTATEIVNYFAKQAAYLGFMFAWNETDALTGIIGENNSICIPTFDGGITTGNYTRGIENVNNPAFLWRDDVYEKNNYDPSKTPDTDSGYLNNKPTSYPRYSYYQSVYDLDMLEFRDFVQDVNGLYLNDPTDGYKQCQLDFKGSNPTDYIIGVYGIPFAPNLLVPSAPSDSIQIGPVTLPNAKGKLVDTSTSVIRSCGSISVSHKYGDFRDYAPYSQYLLYVPMFGMVELDGAEIVGHDIELVIYYDICTVAATACIYRDSMTLIKTINGTIGATLPMTAARMGDYQNAMHTLQNAISQNEIKIATSALTTVGALVLAPETGGLSLVGGVNSINSLVDSSMNISDLKYQINHKQPSIATLSSASGAVAQWCSTFTPVLYCRHAHMLSSYDEEIYSHTVGNACCINAAIGDMSGFTVATNIDTNDITTSTGKGLTADEINSIKQMFKDGVYL